MLKRLCQSTDLCQLNNDIPFDVLSRLPADKLVQLRRVSKQWENVITDPDFRRFQMMTAEPIPISGYFFQERFEYSDIDVETLSYIPLGVEKPKIYQDVLAFLPEKVTILASSNGLICCRSCIPSADPSIYICNPINKEWMILKCGNFQRRDCIAFSFKPFSVSSIHATKNYKLVRVFEIDKLIHGKEELFFGFEVYDWEKKSWIKSKEICQCEDSLCSNKNILVEGILYCLTDGMQVLTFDVENELSFLMPLPITFTNSKCAEICLGESDGKLNCVVVSQEALLIWALLDRFTSKWDLISFLSFEVMEKENPEYLLNLAERVSSSVSETAPWMHPLAYKDGHLFLRVSNSAFSLDINTRKMKLLCNILDLGREVIVAPAVVPYAISLAPVGNP